MKFFKIFAFSLIFIACGKLVSGDEETPLLGNPVDPLVQIPGKESPAANQYCLQNPDGSYSDAVKIEMGSENNYVWAQGGACVFRSIRETWAVLHNQPLMVWDGVTSSSYKLRNDLPEGVAYFYEVKYHVDEIIDVDWMMNWYHTLKLGTKETPQELLINYKKVKGTKFISYWEGTVMLFEVTPSITAVIMRDQIKASRTEPQDSANAVRDVIQKLRTGAPNWGPL